MKLNELVQKRSKIIDEMEAVLKEAEKHERSMNEEESNKWNELDNQRKDIEKLIEQRKAQDELNAKEVKRSINLNKVNKMSNFKEIIKRNGDTIENFKVRALDLTAGIYDVQTASNISVVGYEPFYKQMGVEIMPNLVNAIKLPYTGAIKAGKKSPGNRQNNDQTLSTVLLSPERYTITETIGRELLAVGNEAALQAFLMEMVKGCDRAVTKDIYDQALEAASKVSNVDYTTTGLDTLVGEVDGDVSVLMPRAEFYKAKGVKIDDGSGLFLASKINQFAGNLWDGTPVFYSNLFDGAAIVAADLKHITVGEFGDEYEVIFDYYSKAPEGQVVVTVAKIASVKVRNANAVRQAIVSASADAE